MSEKFFPKGWVETTIGDVCIFNPRNDLDDSDIVSFLPMAAIPQTFGEKPIYKTRIWAEVKKGYTHYQNSDVLFAKVTPCFENGKSMFVENCPTGFGSGSSELIVLRSNPDFVIPKLLLNLIRSYEFKQLGARNMTGAVGLRRVPKAFVEQYPFPLPPLAEQKEIARQLDDLLAQVDILKTRLDSIPAILKRFRQSTLAAAVSGKLTEEWRGENGNRDWITFSFGDLVETANNGLAKRRGTTGDEVTVLRLADFKNAKRVFGNERKIFLTPKECDKYLLGKGDLLIIRVNGSVDLAGLFILYDEAHKREAYCDHFIRFTAVDKANPKFITYVTNEGEGRRYLRESLSTSAGQNTINQKSIKALQIDLPPIEEQAEIVRRVEELFAFADQVEQRVKDAQSRVNHLTQSILAKAFRGELTADWRAANPDLITGKNSAEALLKRLRRSGK